MCIGIPALVERCEGSYAVCRTRDGLCQVDLTLTGPVPEGSWLLAFQGAARECIDAQRAHEIDAALDALAAIAQGQTDVDGFFPDLVDREPQLPPHLQAQLQAQQP
ncbi:MAG: HypC/HybG/HupF family hydrogenase formation chaperone [Burkholderiaceae bacterium]|jgi:hydrogenase expression/formation protein HypC|nr:HypC/HybG/HupF family hydrogenase formation chaperone [Burkholderiaceae bacterium]